MPWKAASAIASGGPTNVTTVRFVSSPGSTSKTVIRSIWLMWSTIKFIFSESRPSEKFGTHSINLVIDQLYAIVFKYMIKNITIINIPKVHHSVLALFLLLGIIFLK